MFTPIPTNLTYITGVIITFKNAFVHIYNSLPWKGESWFSLSVLCLFIWPVPQHINRFPHASGSTAYRCLRHSMWVPHRLPGPPTSMDDLLSQHQLWYLQTSSLFRSDSNPPCELYFCVDTPITPFEFQPSDLDHHTSLHPTKMAWSTKTVTDFV